jgi:2-polyprenyl-3-methyl-5-hydroxy-6-metoxy-1,4-benzoquinol methylase
MDKAVHSSSQLKCNVCAAVGPHPLVMRKADDGRNFGEARLHRCLACGTVFLGDAPQEFETELYRYYVRLSGLPAEEVYPNLTHSRYVALLEFFASQLEDRNFLDVGCGVGGFVRAAIELGWNGRGIDLAEAAIAVGSKFGLPLSCTDFFSEEIPSESVNLITMFEFIEHVPDPGAFLNRAEAVLRKGGLLYVTTPNFDSLDRYLLGSRWEAIHVEHLSYFTPRTLQKLVVRCTNLQVEEVVTKNLSVGLVAGLLAPFGRSALTASGGAAVRSEVRQDTRESIENSRVLSGAKQAANALLTATGLGSAMTMTLKKVCS